MLLDLRDLRGPEDLVERSIAPSALDTGAREDYVVAAPVVLALRIRKDGDKYRLRGRLTTTVRRECCRCLEPFDAGLALDVDLRYLPHAVNTGEGEDEISDEDLSTAFYREDQIDLGELIREQLQLASPMKPLCHDGCRGLCPMCGTNRNIEACQCDAAWHDPRLDVLRSLLSDGPAAGRTRKD